MDYTQQRNWRRSVRTFNFRGQDSENIRYYGYKMTAEIAVHNKSAVALAADSAVTISGGNVFKINNGAEKLFALSKHHPVGIMVYGTASLCGVPWEMIIKHFRKTLGEQSFDTVQEYATNFWNFLCSSNNIIPNDLKDNHLISILKNNVFSGMLNYTEENDIRNFISMHGRQPNAEETYTIIEESCNIFVNNSDGSDFFSEFTEDDFHSAVEFSIPVAIEVIDEKLKKTDISEIPTSLVVAVAKVFASVICKKSNFGSNTGVVFAGYGNQEFFPAILAFDVLGFFMNKLRMSPNMSKSTSGGDSGVIPYAQEDEVASFLQGTNEQVQQHNNQACAVALQVTIDQIKELTSDLGLNEHQIEDFGAKVTDIASQSFGLYKQATTDFIAENYISSVVEMIEFLPKQDLGYMAESLVNLTAFKRRVSNNSETVGGPIDVAIISKGDGFIWVKRKHYFDKDLNHHFFNQNLR